MRNALENIGKLQKTWEAHSVTFVKLKLAPMQTRTLRGGTDATKNDVMM